MEAITRLGFKIHTIIMKPKYSSICRPIKPTVSRMCETLGCMLFYVVSVLFQGSYCVIWYPASQLPHAFLADKIKFLIKVIICLAIVSKIK